MNDFEKIKQKLNEEYNINCMKITELDRKIKTIMANTLESKISLVIALSVLPYIIYVLAGLALATLGIVSIELIPVLISGFTILTGVTIESLITKNLKYKEKLQRFSKARTEQEKLEEAARYEIEKKKLESSNKVLKEATNILTKKENLITLLSDNYIITEKEKDERDETKIDLNIEKINKDLEKQQKNIENAATKLVLNKEFFKVRDKLTLYTQMLLSTSFGGMGGMVIYSFPIVFLQELTSLQFPNPLAHILIPGIVSGLTFSGYKLKSKKNLTTVFNILNQELGENSLSKFSEEKDNQLEEELETMIINACETKSQLETEKRKLENLISEKNKILEQQTYKQLSNNEILNKKLEKEESVPRLVKKMIKK